MTSSRRSDAEVDVDVRVGRPTRVDEALEQQVVGDRLDPADPQRVRHDRAGRTAPTLGRDPALLRELHEVPADEEELGETGPLDDVEFVREPGHDRRGHRVVAAARPGPAQLREVGERRLPVRHREAREAVLLEAEIDRHEAASSTEVGDALRPGSLAGHERRQLLRPTSGTTRHPAGAGPPASRASGRGGWRSGRRPVRDPPVGRSGRRWSPRPAGRAPRRAAAASATSQSSSAAEVVRQLDEEAAAGRSVAPAVQTVAYRSATARAPARSPTRRRRISSPSRHPDRATRPSVSSVRSAWLKRGTPFVPAMFAFETSRHRLRQPDLAIGPAGRGAGRDCARRSRAGPP